MLLHLMIVLKLAYEMKSCVEPKSQHKNKICIVYRPLRHADHGAQPAPPSGSGTATPATLANGEDR